MEKSIVSEIAENLGKEEEDVAAIIDEFALQLHRRLYEYKGLNGDYVGGELHYHIGKQAFYHLLGFIECFSAGYNWDEGSASEYLMRLGSKADWLPYRHQMEAWRIKSK